MLRAVASALLLIILTVPAASAHVVNPDRTVKLSDDLSIELLGCLQNHYKSVTCRFLVHSSADKPIMSPEFQFKGSRLTSPDLRQVQFKYLHTSEERFQSANSDFGQFMVDPGESIAFSMSLQSTAFSKYPTRAIFPEIKILANGNPIYFSDVPNE